MKASLLLSCLNAEWAKHCGIDIIRQCNGGGALE